VKVRNWFKGPESVSRTFVALAVALSVAGAATGGIQFAEAAIIGEGNAAESASLMTDHVVRTKVESLEETASVDLASLTKAAQKTATPLAAPRARAATSAVRRAAVAQQAPASSSGWKSARVSWYGPGFYGNTMAGGGTLTTSSMVVAHRSMRFGTKIQFSYKGRTCVAVVQDRGPFVGGRTFDLGPGTAKALGFSGVGTVQWRIVQ
jgi:rare lipoprotein A (peptidoglycan hydrolase)